MKLSPGFIRVLFSGIVFAASSHSQTPGAVIDARPGFDVAAVKINESGTGVDRIRISNGSLIIENVSLRRLISMAYEIPESQGYLLSGPEWLDSESFDIQARYAPDTPDSEFQLMFQRLLEERFRMAVHREQRLFSVLALVRGKEQGRNLHPAVAPGGAYKFKASLGHATGFSISMAMLAGRLSRPDFGLSRPVVDFTGLTGTFDLTLDWRPESPGDGTQTPDGGSDASILTAVKEQLGLELEARRASLEVLVIDRASKAPTAN